MIFKDQNLIELIGKPIFDSDVQKLLKYVGVIDKKIKIKRGESDAAIDCKNHGIVFNFAELSDDVNNPEGTLFLIAIHAMANKVQGHKGFAGILPMGLSFIMSDNDVRKIMGKPDWTSPVLPIHRWNKQKIQIVIEFTDEKAKTIDSIVVQKKR
jgi:hypothetical protein